MFGDIQARHVQLRYLSLTNFRNYTRLELDFPERLVVFQGANAQGKTNLLEAIHLLATGRSPRAVAERELISWLALESPLPYARLEAEIGEDRQRQKLELVLELAPNGGGNGPRVRKQVRINGVPKRGIDLVGHLRVVLFLPEDISLIAGAPGERRRYLDIALCQISQSYCRALSEYNKTLSQRNALLKQLREEGGDAGQLTFWDERLVEFGGAILQRRADAIASLSAIAALRHRDLTGGAESLSLRYLPSPEIELNARGLIAVRPDLDSASLTKCQAALTERLARLRNREIAAGTSLVGPHRDDLLFIADDRDLRTYGSRGQQRTAALALKLAEIQLMREVTGDDPVLLLDDVMSELDSMRRHTLLDALAGVPQALVTTTDWNDFTPELLGPARKMTVCGGRIAMFAPPSSAE